MDDKILFDRAVSPSSLKEYMGAADLLGLEYKIEKLNVNLSKTKVFVYRIIIYETH